MSDRELTPAVHAELGKTTVQVGLFVEMIFDDGPFRVWSGTLDRTIDGNVFKGVGHFGGIDQIQESSGEVRSSGVKFSLSGIPMTNETGVNQLALMLLENFQGRPATVWFQMFDIDWGEIDDPIRLNNYKLDYPVIDKGGESFTITVYAESMLADLERPRVQRYTHEDQQTRFPGDKGFEFVATMQNKAVKWQAPAP